MSNNVDELIEAQILSDPVYFAEIYLRSPSNPKEPLVLRPYQKKILRDKAQKKLLRLGRRTGKTVTLAIEAIWKAFTNSNREILLTAGYDSQIATLFNLINRMVADSGEIGQSVARTRMRPWEIEFKNGSVIMGYVANNAIRGKCLPGTSIVVMADGALKHIKELEVGDKVLSIDTETEQGDRVEGEVTAIHNNGIKDIYALKTTSDRIIHLTENHKVYAFYKGWVEVKDIQTQEKFDSKSDFVSIIHPDGKSYWARAKTLAKVGKAKTYDITVDPTHNFVAFNEDPDSHGSVAVGINVTSGHTITGSHTGGFLVHNSASDLYIDEVDSIPNEALIEAVMPIATTFKHTTMTVSGTPTGKREYFYQVSRNLEQMGFNEFHYPSFHSPEWTEELEAQIRLVTSDLQYEHEYLAEFGSSAEGVFKNKFIDENLYVYSYESLKYNPNNYYILGVDWNESMHGVQAVILEYMSEPEMLLPYNDGQWKLPNGDTINKVKRSNALRVFYADKIDPKDYTNVGSVEFIIKLMKKIPFSLLSFDRGHGEANYELLRLSLKKGEGPLGTKCKGMAHFLDNMMSVEMGGTTEVIDKVTGQSTKAPTKNVMVKNSQLLNETGQLILPAVNLKGIPVELEEVQLVGQMRGYVVAKYGKHGEVYESTVRDGLDHRLDAMMLGIYAYTMNTSDFFKRESDLIAENVDGFEPAMYIRPGWRSNFKENIAPHIKNVNGAIVYDHGHWGSAGEPPEYTKEESIGISSKFKHSPRSNKRSTRRRF